MTDEGDGLREPPLAEGRGIRAPGGEPPGAGAAGAEGARMDDTAPQDGAGAGGRSSGNARMPGTPSGDSAPGGDRGPGGSSGADGGPGNAARATSAATRGRARKGRSFWRELPVLIVVALFLTLVIKTYAIQAFYIPSGSMENTLEIGDRVLVNKLAYDFGSVHRGDIVVFSGNGSWNPGAPPLTTNFFGRFAGSTESMFGFGPVQNDYIKRVIGLPGDHVACCDTQGDVTVNGVALQEQSYLYPGNTPSEQRFNITVPPGRLWVMGDHRDVSFDSRGHKTIGDADSGTIPESAVVGRAFVIIWPLSQWRILPVPATFSQRGLAAQGNAPAAAAPPPRVARPGRN